ncbi:glycoside hydrolase family 3 protein [Microbacterium sp. NEAU-LLC]|uniref:Glycoside hydrolase family 3 protein n=2 Tax=Microbacterium helvum TaxID=2773713 RepID=A0ABR8NMV1_9MICO|nr:glycoside hydrolase family 3 protein [Microbacterium helvum]
MWPGAAAALAVAAITLALGAPAASASRPAGAVARPATDAAVEEDARELVRAMSIREQAASVVMGHVPTTDPAALQAYMQSTGIGGFLLMGANIPGDEASLRAVTAALTVDPALPPLLAVDQEGGDVSRLPWDDFPSALTLKGAPPEAVEDAFAGRAALVRRAGIGVNFGIVADETDDPRSFIYRRVLGTTPDAAATSVAAAVRGESDVVASTLKHFPGHGVTEADSHATIPATSLPFDQWRQTAAVPFAAGIATDAPVLMFGHLAYTAVDPAPASLSPEWHRIAREDLGFTGVSVTDDLGMLQASGDPQYADPSVNAVAALAAGNDLVLTVVSSTPETAPRIVDAVVAAVETGTLPAARLEEAATRVAALRLHLAAQGQALLPCPECTPAG